MTQAGLVLGLLSVFGLLGNMIGGALTDRFGRRKLILFGLVFSALSTLTLGLVNEFSLLFPLAMVIGVLSDIAGPAHQAMLADHPDLTGYEVYACGSVRMVEAAIPDFVAHGLSEEFCFSDAFTPKAAGTVQPAGPKAG